MTNYISYKYPAIIRSYKYDYSKQKQKGSEQTRKKEFCSVRW